MAELNAALASSRTGAMGYNVSSKSNVISPSRRFFFNFVVLFFVSLSCSSVEVERCVVDDDTTTRLEEESGAKLYTSGTTSSVESSRVKATNFMIDKKPHDDDF
jgi:hypothetical protein